MKSLLVLVVLAACAQTCLAVPAGTPADDLVPVPAAVPTAAPAAPKPEVAVKPEAATAAPADPAAAPAVPAVPVESATAAAAASPAPLPPTPAVPVPAAADSANKMGQLVAAPALNSTKGAICVQVATAADASCSEDRQCVRLLNSVAGPEGPAVCVAGKCMCRYDHVLENGTCVHKQARGKSCAADAECADLDGGACIQGVCGCKQDFVPAVAANKCLPVLRELAAPCEEDIQCSEGLGDLGRCSAAKCACPDGAAVSAASGKCACAEDEVLNKEANRCEKAAPTAPAAPAAPAAAQQQPIKESSVRNANKDNGAATLQASMTAVVMLAYAAFSAL